MNENPTNFKGDKIMLTKQDYVNNHHYTTTFGEARTEIRADSEIRTLAMVSTSDNSSDWNLGIAGLVRQAFHK